MQQLNYSLQAVQLRNLGSSFHCLQPINNSLNLGGWNRFVNLNVSAAAVVGADESTWTLLHLSEWVTTLRYTGLLGIFFQYVNGLFAIGW